jgi:hypothetical protein
MRPPQGFLSSILFSYQSTIAGSGVGESHCKAKHIPLEFDYRSHVMDEYIG